MLFKQAKQGFTPLFVIPSTQAHVTPQGFCAGYKSFFVAPLYPALLLARRAGMTSGGVKGMTNTACGFTLIELLVVVLIIGILAAVALPQYEKAVLKSRFASIRSMITSLKNAEETFFLANGNYTEDLTKLDIDHGCKVVSDTSFIVCDKYWGIDVINDGNNILVMYCPNNLSSFDVCSTKRDFWYKVWFTHSTYPDQASCGGKSNLAKSVCQSLNL